MNNSLFDFFKEKLFESYIFLKDYELEFSHTGQDDSDLTYYLEISSTKQIITDFEVERNFIIHKIKDFGKIFAIKIVVLSDFAFSGTTTTDIYR